MGKYADGFLLPIQKKNIEKYRRMSRTAGKIWREHGALEYRETVYEDTKLPGFLKIIKAAKNETAVFSWIVYKSRTHRDRVLKKVMSDPRLAKMMTAKDMPFDMKRMLYGGFRIFVEV